jgi:hypothetical protein
MMVHTTPKINRLQHTCASSPRRETPANPIEAGVKTATTPCNDRTRAVDNGTLEYTMATSHMNTIAFFWTIHAYVYFL